MRILPAALLAATLLLASCEKKLTQDNVNLVTTGMTLAQVEEILGPGEDNTPSGTGIDASGIMSADTTKGDVKTYYWRDGNAEVTVELTNGKVSDIIARGL